jgi:hypothetical protein
MKDIPIILSAPMIEGLVSGRKTMTRRLLYSERYFNSGADPSLATIIEGYEAPRSAGVDGFYSATGWQNAKPGDRLWVKEELRKYNREPRATCQYAADLTGVPHRGMVDGTIAGQAFWNWKRDSLSGRYTPRWASRFTLVLTETKIERVQSITRADAAREGVCLDLDAPSPPPWFQRDKWPEENFAGLWEFLHGARAWLSNPWVVALGFTLHQQNIDEFKQSDSNQENLK